MPKPGKVTKEELATLANLSDEHRADLAARFDEIAELETQIGNLTKAKGDADQIVARAGEVEKASKAKDAKILELEGLLAQHTGKKESGGLYGIFSGFFADGTF